MRAVGTAVTAALILLVRGARAAEAAEGASQNRPVSYFRISVDRALGEPRRDPEASTTTSNSTDAESLSYLHGSPGVTLGYSHPVLRRLCLDGRIAYARIMAVQGGPRTYGFDLGVSATLHLVRTGGRRGFGVGISLPLTITIPAVANAPEAQRAVVHSVDAHIGWSAGGEINAFWYIDRSVLSATIFLVNRWTPFTWSSWLESDPSIRNTSSYNGEHAQLGIGAGYGWAF